jgi:hypothetical protein
VMKWIGIISAFLVALGFLAAPTLAQTAPPMTQAHIERIRTNCTAAQSRLTTLHANDGLLRVNRGQVYESISTKLMAPFNSRVSLAKRDSLGLTTITARYEQQLDDFRARYKEYEESLSAVLRISCTNQPVAFFDAVAAARQKRQATYEATQRLQKSIQDYGSEFEKFRVQLQKEKSL